MSCSLTLTMHCDWTCACLLCVCVCVHPHQLTTRGSPCIARLPSSSTWSCGTRHHLHMKVQSSRRPYRGTTTRSVCFLLKKKKTATLPSYRFSQHHHVCCEVVYRVWVGMGVDVHAHVLIVLCMPAGGAGSC